jgi:FkbM family methyltransferase
MAALLGGCRRPPESVPAAAPPSTPPPPASPASAPAASAILAGKPLYSQHNEELVVRDFFQDRRDGVFLDVGCASPIEDNNTYYLEKHLGWSGLAVDALPEFAQPWERKRPRSRFFNFYVSDHAGTVEPFYRSALRGVSSGRKDQKGPGGKQVPLQEIQVPTTTLNKLLDTNGVTRLDFLSMDIEGHEPAALAGFDIKRFRPALACVETKPANRDTITRYFAANGYERLDRYLEHDTVNWYFAPRASPN